MSTIAFDWRSIWRWCLLGTIVMLLWLLAPTAKCSWTAFRETPLSEVQPQTGGAEPPEEPGFLSKMGNAISGCYKRTPLFGQEDWKTTLFIALAALTVITRLLYQRDLHRRRSYDQPR